LRAVALITMSFSLAVLKLITVKKQLEHLQRLACPFITGVKRTAPRDALEIITDIVPLAMYIKSRDLRSISRFDSNLNRPFQFD